MSEPFPVYAEPDSVLAALLQRLGDAELDEKAAKERVKALKDGIKSELTVGYTTPAGEPHTNYRAEAHGAVPRVLRWTPSVRIDTPKLKAERPEIYQAYSKASGAWVLAVAK